MKVEINDISEQVIDEVKRKIFFSVTYTEKSLLLKRVRKVNCCADILTNIKSLVDYYDLDNWQPIYETLGHDKSKGVGIYIESFFRENYKTTRQ